MSTFDESDNVLFLFTDQQRADSLGCYGGEARTPHVDNLADRGTRFDRAYTPTAICTPTRSSIVRGQRPSRTGVTANAGKSWTEPPESIADGPCYPQLLRDEGYTVGLIGKSHFACDPSVFGFDGAHFPGAHYPFQHEEYEAYLEENGLPHYDDSALESRTPDPSVGRLDAAIDPRPVEASFPYFLAERTIDRIENYAADDRPFYLGTHFFGPHRPYILPREYFELYDPDEVSLPDATVKETFLDKPAVHEEQYWYWQLDRVDTKQWRQLVATYRGFVTLIDEQIGRILQALEEHGLRNRTTIAFSSDHGAFATRHKMQDKGPAMYEDIYRVPLIVDSPGSEASGHTEERFASLLDLSPTFLEACGVEVPLDYDGRSLGPLLDGEDPDEWREDVLLEFDGLQYAYPQRALRTDRYKLVVNPPDGDELYDLERDPDELTNRIGDADYADVRARLYDRLAERLEAVDDDFPATDPNFFPGRRPDRRQ